MNTHSVISQTPYIGCIETLGYSDDNVAQSYMKYITQRIALILPHRGWRIGTLKEFYPRQSSLLGLNVQQGVEICIRLRVPGNKGAFLPFHEVVCTALHELAHCQENKHNMPFWNLYYELLRECEAIEVKMLLQGRMLYPEHIVSSAEDIIAKRIGDKSQKKGRKRPEKPKLESNQHSTANNISLFLDSPSNVQALCGIGHRLGGVKLPNGSKPNAAFIATVIESRLQRQDAQLFGPTSAGVNLEPRSSPKDDSIGIYARLSSPYELCERWNQNHKRECEARAEDAIISLDEEENPRNTYEEQEERPILKHRRLEQAEDDTVCYTANGIHDDAVGLQASCPITID